MQANVRTNDLLNAIDFAKGSMVHCAAASSNNDAVPAQTEHWAAIVGEQYYARKRQLILDEQIVLRAIDFNIVVDHPHKYLMNFAKTIKASSELVQLAVCVLNDSLVYTNLSVSCSAPEVAAGTLHLATQLLDIADKVQHQQGQAWWEFLGCSTATVTHVGAMLLDALTGADSL